jgi:hypothetical protein
MLQQIIYRGGVEIQNLCQFLWKEKHFWNLEKLISISLALKLNYGSAILFFPI